MRTVQLIPRFSIFEQIKNILACRCHFYTIYKHELKANIRWDDNSLLSGSIIFWSYTSEIKKSENRF